MTTIKKLIVIALTATALIAGCGEKKEADTTIPASASHTQNESGTLEFFKAEGVTSAISETVYTVAGVSFFSPELWRDQGSTSMRKAQLAFGPIEDDTDSSTMVLFYFGKDQGGPIQANLDRWISQVPQADGSNSMDKAVRSTFEAGGMKAHVVEVSGVYNAGGSAMGSEVEKSDYLLVGVVLEGPQGNLFYKLTGPKKTASVMAGHFAQMFESVKIAE